MSDSERPDVAALQELEQLIQALGDEMAAWRRRAHEAEARLRELEARTPESDPTSSPAYAALVQENQELRLRLETARQRTKQLLGRLRFLRQQHELGVER